MKLKCYYPNSQTKTTNVEYNLKASKTGYDPLPNDRYTLYIKSTKIEPHVKNDVTGERIEIVYEVSHPDYPNRKLWDYIYLPQAPWKARTLLEAIGRLDVADSEKVTATSIAAALIGGTLSAYVTYEMGTSGKMLAKISDYKPLEDINLN